MPPKFSLLHFSKLTLLPLNLIEKKCQISDVCILHISGCFSQFWTKVLLVIIFFFIPPKKAWFWISGRFMQFYIHHPPSILPLLHFAPQMLYSWPHELTMTAILVSSLVSVEKERNWLRFVHVNWISAIDNGWFGQASSRCNLRHWSGFNKFRWCDPEVINHTDLLQTRNQLQPFRPMTNIFT